ncbi:MAG: permease prefix domain 1-containing protein [Oscillospiraceae bacterium]|jgi:hypothetical protein|nr:permease prefix domain 1-containing protein [Oscillospiraceae bacterium]
MRNQIEQALSNIFNEYEETQELKEFKEEITVNLIERIKDKIKTGIEEQEAIQQALSQLGDITEAADLTSRQTRKELIFKSCVTKPKINKFHAVGYTFAGLSFILGLIIAGYIFSQYIFSQGIQFCTNTSILCSFPFLVISIGAFVYLGLTQETTSHYPMSKKRSFLYAISASLFMLGLLLASSFMLPSLWHRGTIKTFFFPYANFTFNRIFTVDIVRALGISIPFMLPALGIFTFLILTEKSRIKPWLQKAIEKQCHIYDEKFELLCGAIWMCVIGFAGIIWLLCSWAWALTIIPFGVTAQLLLLYFFAEK